MKLYKNSTLCVYLAALDNITTLFSRLLIFNGTNSLNNIYKNSNANLQTSCNLEIGKGQLISKCLLGDIVLTKKPTKFFKGFLP